MTQIRKVLTRFIQWLWTGGIVYIVVLVALFAILFLTYTAGSLIADLKETNDRQNMLMSRQEAIINVQEREIAEREDESRLDQQNIRSALRRIRHIDNLITAHEETLEEILDRLDRIAEQQANRQEQQGE